MSKVLVTGAAGQVGARLVRQLLARNYEVRGTLLPEDPAADRLAGLDIERVEGDLREPEFVREAVEGVDAVLHTANLVGAQHFFDGFGFERYRNRFGWSKTPLDDNEASHAPQNPLLPFLERLNRALPKKWNSARKMFVPDDDWILWDLRPQKGGANVAGPRRRKI